MQKKSRAIADMKRLQEYRKQFLRHERSSVLEKREIGKETVFARNEESRLPQSESATYDKFAVALMKVPPQEVRTYSL